MKNKGLRFHTMIIASLAVLAPCLAVADAPANMALGEVDALLQFCGKTDSRFEQDTQKLQTSLTGKATRGTAEYKQGHDLMSAALAKVSKAQALAACTQSLEPRKHRDDDRSGRR
jgi:hypothetical protein